MIFNKQIHIKKTPKQMHSPFKSACKIPNISASLLRILVVRSVFGQQMYYLLVL